MNPQSKDLQDRLWAAAEHMRANSSLKLNEISEPILGLIFLKFAEVRFNEPMEVQIIELDYTFKKDNKSWGIMLDRIQMPNQFKMIGQTIVYLPPEQIVGNHKHSRKELGLLIGNDLELIWIDNSGKIHKKVFNSNLKLEMFLISPFVPHAIINKSANSYAVLYELVDNRLQDTERVDILS